MEFMCVAEEDNVSSNTLIMNLGGDTISNNMMNNLDMLVEHLQAANGNIAAEISYVSDEFSEGEILDVTMPPASNPPNNFQEDAYFVPVHILYHS